MTVQPERRTEPMCFFMRIILLGVAMKYLSPVYEMEGVKEFKRLECRPAYSRLKMHASERLASLASPKSAKPTPTLMTIHAVTIATMYESPPSARAGR